MRIVDNYNYLPGCCWFCRGVSKPIIDCEIDLDGVNSPDSDNPSAITRLYVCADCAIEMGRMVANGRALEFNRMGELAQAHRVANEQAERAEIAEERLAVIAGAIAGVTSPMADTAGSVTVPDEGGTDPVAPPAAEDALPLRRRGRPRREQPTEPEINTDFLGDL
jgi:hypothetical protein